MIRDFLLSFVGLMLFVSCQKVDLDEYLQKEEKAYTMTFNVARYSISDFGETGTDAAKNGMLKTDSKSSARMTKMKKSASELGTVLNFAVFNDAGKLVTVNQKSTDEDFGTVSVSLAAGDYKVVALVHSCSGNATLSSTEKVSFPNNKVTDTFCYYSTLSVSEDKNIDANLNRVVSKFHFTVEDAIPDNITQMQFYYTGGSSTLNPETGYGCVNSKQTEIRDVTSHDAGQVFEVYTMPHESSDELTMTVSALDANGTEYYKTVLNSVPVEIQKVTNTSMKFFDESTAKHFEGVTFTGDGEWKGEITY